MPTIDITPLEIRLRNNNGDGGGVSLTKEEGDTPLPIRPDALQQYYLNLDNLTGTSAADIEELILSFWTQLQHPTAQHHSLTVLELSPPVTYEEIKRQYRRLASKHHPDKGGSTEKLQTINQAMATLSQRQNIR